MKATITERGIEIRPETWAEDHAIRHLIPDNLCVDGLIIYGMEQQKESVEPVNQLSPFEISKAEAYERIRKCTEEIAANFRHDLGLNN
jgi:hypothetical protein